MRKKPRTGLLLILVAIGALAVGYFLGWEHGRGQRVEQARSDQARTFDRDPWEEATTYGWEEDEEEPEAAPAPTARPDPETEPVTPSELIQALRENAGSPRSQQILIGMVADAARVGGAMLPEIQRLLDEGTDIKFSSYDGKTGYPSLRVALLAAAEATGDPEAIRMIAEVAQTSESPVEIVFSAHILDNLDALDKEIAQRTLDSLLTPLSPEEKKAIAAVARKVIPAATKADPAYAENFLAMQLRAGQGAPRADPRLLAPVLDGLPMERARNIVLDAMTAVDVPDRAKHMLAGRAAQRPELSMLTDLRSAIESNTLPVKVSATIARSAMSGGRFGRLERNARRAVKKGDFAAAQKVAKGYESRLVEARRTVEAARTAGAKVPKDINTRATLYRQRLDSMLAYIHHTYNKQLKQQQKAK